MQLTHRIALVPTRSNGTYFAMACGTARRTWNWAIDMRDKQKKTATCTARGKVDPAVI